MNCPRCQRELSRDSVSCATCGYSFDDATKKLESTLSGKTRDKPFFIAVLYRYGLLALATMVFVMHLWAFFPMTTELRAWYAFDFVIAGVLCLALTTWAFYTSLAGQKLFVGNQLDD